MKNDEYLRLFIDNELSANDKSKFAARLESDQGLNQELDNLTDVEKSLADSKTTLRDSDIAFLGGVKTDLISNIKKQPADKFTQLKLKELSANFALLISLILLFVSGSLVSYYFANQEKNNHEVSYKPIKTSHQPNLTKLDNEILSIENKIAENTPEATKYAGKDVKNKEIQVASTEEKNELTLSIMEKNLLTNQQLVDKLKSDLENYERNSDLLNTAVTKKRLGQLFGKINGKSEEAKIYLIQSASIFEKLKYVEMQAECFGELAIIELSTGNKANAGEYLSKCIQMLQSSNSKKIKYWQDKYDKNFRE